MTAVAAVPAKKSPDAAITTLASLTLDDDAMRELVLRLDAVFTAFIVDRQVNSRKSVATIVAATHSPGPVFTVLALVRHKYAIRKRDGGISRIWDRSDVLGEIADLDGVIHIERNNKISAAPNAQALVTREDRLIGSGIYRQIRCGQGRSRPGQGQGACG
ncbi:MAG: hypothetical protein C4567_15850 [Deltaproteobacteria bacterium]|nr:MAG: hypothetical protein C4567_15850 [Deltaproteobacteria bacterium]